MPLNARLFIWFRLLFNCRFYYPIFTVLFLDLGLSIGEFAALNVVWALTIVLLEVPSGALADQIGRRALVVASGWLMVAEMAVLCLMPVGNHDVVLWLFVVNRVLSGAAEAAASGADEALTYDSLPPDERPTLWPRIMAKLSRASAIGFIITSISGGLLYDHGKVSAALTWLGFAAPDRAWTMKIPLVLNFIAGVVCLLVTLRMTEPPSETPAPRQGWWPEAKQAFLRIWETGGWIWKSQAAFTLILLGVVFDSIIRLFLTVTSNFYRLVGVTEAWYGVIGTVSSLLALASSGLMERMTTQGSLRGNFIWLTLATFAGLCFAAYPQPGFVGVALVVPLMLSMRFLQFFLSFYLNEIVDSTRRATALSFRGLTINLAYGLMTLLFGWHTQWYQHRLDLPAEDIRAFAASLTWWPWWFLGTLAAALLWIRLRRKAAV
ncbi:Major Facilitator Superfamily protein [Prosthecobacter debontii]|uniref:Major Facilitator Superfamily protein n=1 Tax=Prosthecobacter debontii TaxID=48467 RepID=A0A1T4YLV7_9BACT|nr:MFS transporter [Prosthecobacter debontii]SKB02779.1 Major Facilitator Superfamily protein [Prosthecobacter debontii]